MSTLNIPGVGPISLDFGQWFNGNQEQGVDVAVPVGTPIYAPAAGQIGTEDLGKADWGKRVFVHAAGGLTYAVGHLTSFAVSPGQQVNAGDLIGYSGGAPSDPSSGESTGPHVELQLINAAGQFLNPHNLGDGLKAFFQSGAGFVTGHAPPPGGGGGGIGLPNPLDAVTKAVQGIADTAITDARKAFFLWAGLVIVGLGILLLIVEDLEGALKQGAALAAEHPEAAEAAA